MFVDMCVCVCIDSMFVDMLICECVYVLIVCLLICYRKQYLHGRNGQPEIQDQGAEYLDLCVDLTPSKCGIVDLETEVGG
jgi:hypothetical protein